MRDLVGKAWVSFYSMVAIVAVGGLVNKVPNIDVTTLEHILVLGILLGCLGVAIKTSPNLKKWTSPGRAEILGIISALGLLQLLISTI